MTKILLLVFLAGAASGALAERAAQREPADPGAPASRPQYDSAFAGYRPWKTETAPVGWREANDAMRELRGHVGHLKPGPAPRPQPAAKDKP